MEKCPDCPGLAQGIIMPDISRLSRDLYSAKPVLEEPPLRTLCKNGSPQNVIGLIIGTKDYTSRVHSIRVAIFEACRFRRLDIIKRISESYPDDLTEVIRRWGTLVLHTVVTGGCLELVKYFIDQGIECNCIGHNGNTPLHLVHDHLDILQCLIRDGNANPDIINNDGEKPLHIAVDNGHVAVAKFLIENSGGGDSEFSNGDTLVCRAVKKGFTDVVKLLVERDADLYKTDENKKTPLQIAVENGSTEIVKILVEKSGNCNMVFEDGDTPLSKADKSEVPNKDLIMFLIERGADVSKVNNNCEWLLRFAIGNGLLDQVAILIEKVGNIDIVLEDGETPLYKAAKINNLGIAKLLVGRGADPNKHIGKSLLTDDTPLEVAVKKKSLKMVTIFIEKTADCNVFCSHGVTPLYLAVLRHCSDLVKFLTEKGADVNIRNRSCGSNICCYCASTENRTPLQAAVEYRCELEIIKLLAENGAKFNVLLGDTKAILQYATGIGTLAETGQFIITKIEAENYENRHLLHEAVCSGNLEKVNLFVRLKVNWNSTFDDDGITLPMIAAELGHRDILRYFINETGADLNRTDKKGRNILHYAVWSDEADVVQLVISKCPNFVNKPDNNGETPIFYAADTSVIKALVDASANIDRVDRVGKTPLISAVEHDSYELTRCLLDLGAEVNKTDMCGKTALHYAVGNVKIIDMLIEYGIDYKIVDNCGRNCFLTAISWNKEQAATYFIHSGICNVNEFDRRGFTGLHHAALNGNSEIFIALITEGANCCSRDSKGRTPLDLAAQSRKLNVALCFVEEYQGDVNELVILGSTALHWAVMYGDLELVKALISKGANCEAIDPKSGCAPIHLAARKRRLDILSYFLELKNSCVKLENQNLETPLHCAASVGNIEMIRTLIHYGADVNKRDIRGRSALHRAITCGSEEVVKLLIEHNAEVAAVDNEGQNVFHFAAHSKNSCNIVKYLCTLPGVDPNLAKESGITPLMEAVGWNCAGAPILYSLDAIDFSKRDLRERTVLHWAADAGNSTAVNLLIEKFDNLSIVDCVGYNPLHYAAFEGHLHIVKLLLENGNVPANAEENNGQTALYIAAQRGHCKVVKKLIESGASCTIKAHNGLTPLHIAAKEGYKQIVEHIVNNTGTNVNLQCSRKSTALHHAAKNGQNDVVRALIRLGSKLNIQDDGMETPLHYAAASGKTETVSLLLRKGANVNAASTLNKTALHLSSETGKFGVVEVLLNSGAECNLHDDDGFTPVHFAAKIGSLKIIKLLAKFGARIDEADNKQATPLHWAALNGPTEVVQHLISKGADISKRDKNGSLPLHWAALAGRKYVVQLLLEKENADFDSVNDRQWSCLHFAAKGDHFEVILYLVKKYEADINQRDENGATPLHVAAEHGNLATVEGLIENGAEVNAQDTEGASPLHRASENGPLETVEALLKGGADLNITDKRGNKPVHYASASGFSDIVTYLIEKRTLEINENKKKRRKKLIAPVDEVNSDGATSLHFACEHGRKDVVRCLLKLGATVSCEDKDKSTPILRASAKGHIDIIDVLIDSSRGKFTLRNDGNSCVHLAAENGHSATVQYLVHKGVNVSGRNNNNETALYLAAGRGHLDAVKSLIKKGASVKDFDKDGRTGLHWAARNGHADVVTYLISEQSQINKKDSNLRQPIHLAASGGHLEVVDILIKSSVSTIANSIDKNNVTPVHCAAENGHLEVVQRLLKEEEVTLNQVNAEGWNCAHFAAFNGHLNLIDFMEDVNINGKSESGSTPLHLAAKEGHARVVEKLIEKGGDCNAMDAKSYTPLLLACSGGHTQTVVSLLNNKTTHLHCVTEDGTSAVMYAARSGKVDLLEVLLEKGADLDCVDNVLFTPLHYATYSGSVPMFNHILNKNKELLYRKDIHGKTPIHKAAGEGHVEIIKFTIVDILQLGYERDILSLAAECGRKDVVEYILELLAEPDSSISSTDQFQELLAQSLITACSNGSRNIVQLLVEKFKADPNLSDKAGKGPLHYAAENGQYDVALYLISKNVNINKPDNLGNTPLFYAKDKCHQNVWEALILSGADPPQNEKKP